MEIKTLYKIRFNPDEQKEKNLIWQMLCRDFFQKFIPVEATVIDIGAGYCEFINNINCSQKIAVDLNEDTKRFADPGVQVLNCQADKLESIPDNTIDIVFSSNFFEHLLTKEAIIKTMTEVYRKIKKGGKFIVLQPNIKYLQGEYWDFFDHHIPLTEKSMVEALLNVGFTVETVFSRFLPYTTKSRMPKWRWLVFLYIKIPFLWKIFGKQMLIVANK